MKFIGLDEVLDTRDAFDAPARSRTAAPVGVLRNPPPLVGLSAFRTASLTVTLAAAPLFSWAWPASVPVSISDPSASAHVAASAETGATRTILERAIAAAKDDTRPLDVAASEVLGRMSTRAATLGIAVDDDDDDR